MNVIQNDSGIGTENPWAYFWVQTKLGSSYKHIP